MGVVPLLIFFNEASINRFLDLAHEFFNLFLWSGIGTTPHSPLFKFRFQFQVLLDQFFTTEGESFIVVSTLCLCLSCCLLLV